MNEYGYIEFRFVDNLNKKIYNSSDNNLLLLYKNISDSINNEILKISNINNPIYFISNKDGIIRYDIKGIENYNKNNIINIISTIENINYKSDFDVSDENSDYLIHEINIIVNFNENVVESTINNDLNTTTVDNSISNDENAPNTESLESTRGSEIDDDNVNNDGKIDSKIPTNGSIINISEAKKVPSEITMDFSGPKESTDEVIRNTGYLPFVWYNSYQISYNDIIYFNLDNSSFYPRIKITFRDSIGLIGDKGMPLDDTKIKVFINSRNVNIRSIFIQFKIFNFVSNGSNTFTINGYIDIDDLYISSYKSYKSLTSFNTIKKICDEIGIGYNSNVSDSSDSMTWINFGEDLQSFLLDILESSYISDQSFIFGYIDYYYNFNYIDVEKEINRNIDNDEMYQSYGLKENSNVNDNFDYEKTKSFLTNDDVLSATNSYIKSYKIINNSTSKSLSGGYLLKTRYYDIINKELLNFNIDSLSDNNNNKIKLKSPNKYLSENNYKNVYNGKIDIDNSHINFNYAISLNNRNINELEKMAMDIILPNPNFNLFKFQKIKIKIVNKTNTPSKDIENYRINGDWMILNIYWILEKGRFYQKVRLVKRDLNLTDNEITEINNNSDSNSNSINNENNENPTNIENTDTSDMEQQLNNNQDDSEINSDILITLEQLVNITGLSESKVEKFIEPLNNTLKKYEINTKSRITNFLAQVLHESGNLQWLKEFASGKAYEGRKDLGNTEKGDGVRFKGRGAIQITGRNNYKRVSDALGYDFVSNPKKLEELPWAILSAGWFWKNGSVRGDLNKLADQEKFELITRGINGGTNGIADRKSKLGIAKSVYNGVKPGDNNSLLA